MYIKASTTNSQPTMKATRDLKCCPSITQRKVSPSERKKIDSIGKLN